MTSSSFTVASLSCESKARPLGIDVAVPRLSWQMKSAQPGARQTAYRILAASDPKRLKSPNADLWDSGRIDSDQSLHIAYAGKKPASRQRVYWKVTIWDGKGQTAESEAAWFEMGLLKRADWRAQWIGAALRGGPSSSIPAPFLRKAFRLEGAVERARLYVTALGLYECRINGRRVGESVLTPGWTDYHKRVQYQVYDVKYLLRKGENAIGAILGDGWAVGRIAWRHRQRYFDRPRLLAQLEITLANGRKITVATNGTWKYQFGPILENDLLMGEAYDSRLELPGWDAPGFKAAGWLKAEVFEDARTELVATNGPGVGRTDELNPVAEPVDKSRVERKRFIFDLGQNMVGRVRFTGRAPAGTSVTFRFAETLTPEGDLYTANLRTARAVDNFTFNGSGEQTWEPLFTFHGFRYVELLDYPGPATRQTITGIVLHSDMTPTGQFQCSDPLLNQLQKNIIWGQKGNFLDVPTDCPQRDERLGWTGDIQVFARTAAFNFDIAGFMTKWLQDVADAQGATGAIPPVVPYVDVMLSGADGGPAWADAVIICPWTHYLSYGNAGILEKNFDVMSRFMQFLIDTSPGRIRCAPEYEGWHGFGDWLAINADTPRDLIGTAFLAHDASLMARIAAVLGKREQAVAYQQLCDEVKSAFADRFLTGAHVTKTGRPTSEVRQRIDRADAISRGNLQSFDYGPITSAVFNTDLFTPTQTAYVLALHFGLLPEKLRPIAVDELVADIQRREMHLSTGFVGTPYLPQVLSQNGRLDIAYALLLQKTWPSWLYPVTQGATTIWERWDGWTVERGFQDPGMNSFNHYAYGSIGDWLYGTVAGIEIDPASPGYKHIILRPQPGGGLTQACGKLKTGYGDLESEWQVNDGSFDWRVVVPPNTSATAYVPGATNRRITMNGQMVDGLVHELAAGEHRFVVR